MQTSDSSWTTLQLSETLAKLKTALAQTDLRKL